MIERSGFTLLELSIVLIIIGLVAAGIFVGQEMIEQARIRAFISQVGAYKVATYTFRTKFGEWPGDFDAAEQLWGTESGSCPTATDATPHQATCNGDGNGNFSVT